MNRKDKTMLEYGDLSLTYTGQSGADCRRDYHSLVHLPEVKEEGRSLAVICLYIRGFLPALICEEMLVRTRTAVQNFFCDVRGMGLKSVVLAHPSSLKRFVNDTKKWSRDSRRDVIKLISKKGRLSY